MRVQHIGIAAESVPGHFEVVAMPSANPSVGGVLLVTGFEGEGFMLEFRDPMGAHVWGVFLAARGADDQFVAQVSKSHP